MIAYVSASFASLQGMVAASTIGRPLTARTLQDPQYFWP